MHDFIFTVGKIMSKLYAMTVIHHKHSFLNLLSFMSCRK